MKIVLENCGIRFKKKREVVDNVTLPQNANGYYSAGSTHSWADASSFYTSEAYSLDNVTKIEGSLFFGTTYSVVIFLDDNDHVILTNTKAESAPTEATQILYLKDDIPATATKVRFTSNSNNRGAFNIAITRLVE